ncbi:WD40-repeat-containing domain protein, partial [Polychytrium aggregatum]|uniref:WD40-repeat-containing domain protein n=1 Tax=Polychytrium aggregatum TaxID=110093 RepID=UPI0022FED22F
QDTINDDRQPRASSLAEIAIGLHTNDHPKCIVSVLRSIQSNSTMTTAHEPASLPPLDEVAEFSIKRSHELFLESQALFPTPPDDPPSQKLKLTSKIMDEWNGVRELPQAVVKHQHQQQQAAKANVPAKPAPKPPATDLPTSNPAIGALIDQIPAAPKSESSGASGALLLRAKGSAEDGIFKDSGSSLIRIREPRKVPKPQWHAPWKLMRVISGHLGWVRAVTVDPGNEWFVTGAGDRLIKIWDLASGTLKLTLTGHISMVRGLAVSPRHPYLFSCGEDKQVKCWDLEYNKVIRHYHGHLSGVYSLSLHPTLDVMVTGGRDSVARVWDMRTKAQIFTLGGHTQTVTDVKCQEADPQVLTASSDTTVKLWDLAAGKAMTTLTHHKKAVRALAINPNEFTFASASPDSIRQWKCPEGEFIQNLVGHNVIVNTLSVNQDGVLFSGGDDGSMHFWDWKTGYNFQRGSTQVQPGSLDSESGIFCSTFDRTGLRLITGEADKTIKIWREDENATPETHPVTWKPTLAKGGR